MERTAIYNCKTGQIELRERTLAEQAQVDAQRALDSGLFAQKSDVDLLKERVAVLEAKVRP